MTNDLKILFDSSVLICAMVEAHPKHNPALSWLKRAKDKEFRFLVSAHSLLEIYSVLTTAPFKPNISPATAKKLIETNITKYATIQSLPPNEYSRLLEFITSLELKGGIVYDALIFECAKKSKADKIITSNAADFLRLNIDHSLEIISL